jgi:hypothetical protein
LPCGARWRSWEDGRGQYHFVPTRQRIVIIVSPNVVIEQWDAKRTR